MILMILVALAGLTSSFGFILISNISRIDRLEDRIKQLEDANERSV